MTELSHDNEQHDPELESALRNFRQSVHAWSDAAYARPRKVAAVTRGSLLRAAGGWALSCTLVAGVAGGVVYKHERVVEQRRQAEAERQRAVQQQEQLALAEHQNEDSDTLLSHVDSAISRQVPAAMDPLASLLGEE